MTGPACLCVVLAVHRVIVGLDFVLFRREAAMERLQARKLRRQAMQQVRLRMPQVLVASAFCC